MSNLVGVDENGMFIKEFEVLYGIVVDMDEARLRGEEIFFNFFGMVEGLIGVMNYVVDVYNVDKECMLVFIVKMCVVIY